MYRPASFAVDDVPALHAAIRTRGFAIIAIAKDALADFAYAPVVLDAGLGPRGGVRFHLARSNPLSQLTGARIRLSFLGPDAYVSPDWYVSEGMVPTWNYVAVEATGTMQPLDDEKLHALLADISRVYETRLLPKPPWTPDKLGAEQLARLKRAIAGFAVTFETLEGKFKLSQNRSRQDIEGAIAGLEATDDPASHAIATAMREVNRGLG